MTNAKNMKIQGLTFREGDQFQVGEDSSVYTFINVTVNERYGFEELNAGNEFGGTSSFRINNMESHGLFISKI